MKDKSIYPSQPLEETFMDEIGPTLDRMYRLLRGQDSFLEET